MLEAKDENKKLRLEISSLNERCENLRKEGGSAILDVHAKQDHIDRTQKGILVVYNHKVKLYMITQIILGLLFYRAQC